MPPVKVEYSELIETLSELFRAHGYHGTTLSTIEEASGLGKGSLYHLFADGKDEMAGRVLAMILSWFEENIYVPLESREADETQLFRMYDSVIDFFHQGNRVCLPGSFALYDARDHFQGEIGLYFERWVEALTRYLNRAGLPVKEAREIALQTIALVQGGLVLSRALQDPGVFVRILEEDRKKVTRRLKAARTKSRSKNKD